MDKSEGLMINVVAAVIKEELDMDITVKEYLSEKNIYISNLHKSHKLW